MNDILKGIKESINRVPVIEGPIPVTETSYPFCSMKHCRVPLDLEQYGYVEEEYFISGYANIYDVTEDDRLTIAKEAVPYKNRILVRYPRDREKASGRVYVDILNATQGYDIEDLWHRISSWCLENGHIYVGITSKPVSVMSLKNFNYERYKDLNWSNGECVPMPTISKSATIPGTEEGLFWDMLSQLGMLLRTEQGQKCVGNNPVEFIYLSGQSQSGAYLNTYVSYFDSYIRKCCHKPVYDGYFNIAGALVQRTVRQQGTVGDLKLLPRNMHPSSTPYICITCEGDLFLFNQYVEGDLLNIKIENNDTEDNKCRYYEIPGAPHTNVVCPLLPALEEVDKAGARRPYLDPRILDHINDFPAEYYIRGLLEKLHIWASKGIAPEIVEPMPRSGNNLKRDEFGNALGGLRSPFLDVPIATYIASTPDHPEGISGKMKYFPREKVVSLYGSIENYLNKFREYTVAQQNDGWISKTDAERMIQWSKDAINKLE